MRSSSMSTLPYSGSWSLAATAASTNAPVLYDHFHVKWHTDKLLKKKKGLIGHCASAASTKLSTSASISLALLGTVAPCRALHYVA